MFKAKFDSFFKAKVKKKKNLMSERERDGMASIQISYTQRDSQRLTSALDGPHNVNTCAL